MTKLIGLCLLQIRKNGEPGDLLCRQRQALLHRAYDSRKI